MTGTVQGSKDLKINRMQSFRMVEETDTSKASKCSVRKMVERQTDIMEEQRRAWHRGSIRKGFLSRRCLHLLLNQEWELTTLGGCSRQRDQHRSIKKNRGVRGQHGCGSNMTKRTTAWLETAGDRLMMEGSGWILRSQIPFPTGVSMVRSMTGRGQI